MKPLQLDAVFNLSPNAYMVVDRELRYVAANEAYYRVTGTTPETLLGQFLFSRFPNDPGNPNNASALMLRKSFERVLATGQPDVLALIPYRVPRPSPDGLIEEDRFWSATHTPLLGEDGKVAYIFQHTVDITELQRLKKAAEGASTLDRELLEAGVLQRAMKVQESNRLLDEDRRRLLELFEQAPGFMTVLRGPQHVFEMHNEAYRALTGFRPLNGMAVRQALPDIEGQGFYELLDRVYSTGEPFVGRGLHIKLQRTENGPLEERFLDFIYQPIRSANGDVTGIFVQGHDVTEQKQTENALRESEARFRELNEELEQRVAARHAELQEANRELESFSYSVSHDLRAPLRHIAGFAQLLERRVAEKLDEVSRDYLKTISDAAREGGKLVDDLLSFSRMGRAEIKKVKTDVTEVIAEVQRELAPDAAERKIRWDIGSLPEVSADPVLLRSAFKNLLSNAIKYTRDRPEAVIEIGGQAQSGETHVWVRDNGVGFDMRYVDKLFGVFQRLHPEEAFEGTGIGLANVRRIITRHGGRVWAEGRPNEGATFHLALPVEARLG